MVVQELIKLAHSVEIRFGELLSKHTTYKIGGPALALAFPKNKAELEIVAQCVRKNSIPVYFLGNGSNILFSDQGFSGLVIKLSKMTGVPYQKVPGTICVAAGLPIRNLLNFAAEHGWGGLNFLAGVPGTVGGAVCMNAGTTLGEAKDRLLGVLSLDIDTGEWKNTPRPAMKFAYRHNFSLSSHEIVVETDWKVDEKAPEEIMQEMKEYLKSRATRQPVDLPSCGSVFRNPSEMKAWQVLEKLGLRGFCRGDIQFSPKHPNFIVNVGKGSASDVLHLIQLAKTRAANELGIFLEEEVKCVGFSEKTSDQSI